MDMSTITESALFRLWNGAGQIYNGDIAKGVIIMGVQVFNIVLMLALIGFITFPIVWVYSIYDAYKTAEKR